MSFPLSEAFDILNPHIANSIYEYRTNTNPRIELTNWVLENMKNGAIPICDRIELKMSDILLSINQTHSIFDADKLHSELRILD